MYNFNQQQGFNGGTFGQQGMMYNNQPMQVPKYTQPLTAEDIAALKQNNKDFTLTVSQNDLRRALCTHKNPNGNGIALVPTGNPNEYTCTVCGETFELMDQSDEQIEQITRMFINVLQTIKTFYVDIPVDYVKAIYPALPILEKIPLLYQLAHRNFDQYFRNDFGMTETGNNFGFGMLNGIMGGGFGMPMQNQGMPGAQYPQQQMGQQYPQQNFGQQPGMMGNQYPQQQGNPLIQGMQQNSYAPGMNQQAQGQNQNGAPDTSKVQTTKTFKD